MSAACSMRAATWSTAYKQPSWLFLVRYFNCNHVTLHSCLLPLSPCSVESSKKHKKTLSLLPFLLELMSGCLPVSFGVHSKMMKLKVAFVFCYGSAMTSPELWWWCIHCSYTVTAGQLLPLSQNRGSVISQISLRLLCPCIESKGHSRNWTDI